MRRISSPHWDERPRGARVDMIVLHAISLPDGSFDSRHVLDLFRGALKYDAHPSFAELRGLRVSTHYLIERDGGCVQCVAPEKRAWHAGESCWQGRRRCNDFSIGIELLGDRRTPFTLPQYWEAANLCWRLMRDFPAIVPSRIVAHSAIAPGRKWDPGPWWNWRRFFFLLSSLGESLPPKRGRRFADVAFNAGEAGV